MRIRILSDLHLEFSWQQQHSFVRSLDNENVDVLILAGDICVYNNMIDAMTMLCQQFANSDVIWVHGNHEFYGSNRQAIVARTQQALTQNKNLHWLDCGSITIKGQRFVGAPMWFRNDVANARYEPLMNDFHVIEGFRSWVYDENLRALNLFYGSVDENDIVITHHLPSPRSIAPRFRSGGLNCFFMCDVDNFIRQRGPKLWIHGHTHDSLDYHIQHNGNTVNTTRVICNPRGYFPHDINPDFDKDLTIII